MTPEFGPGAVGYWGDDESGRATAPGICTDSTVPPPPSPTYGIFQMSLVHSVVANVATVHMLVLIRGHPRGLNTNPGPMASGLRAASASFGRLATCTIRLIPSRTEVSVQARLLRARLGAYRSARITLGHGSQGSLRRLPKIGRGRITMCNVSPGGDTAPTPPLPSLASPGPRRFRMP
jgi:hypothetical protein